VQDQLDPKFSRLNYVNKIQILLKALMIEKDQNNQSSLGLEQLRIEIDVRKSTADKIHKENEELIDIVAQSESKIDIKDEEIQVLMKKKMDYKLMIE
jgi:hypothetical protein